jgi:spore maturation protein CgeB
MKILIAGSSWQHPMYESAWRNALEKLGCLVIPFLNMPRKRNIISRLEQKYSINSHYSSEIQTDLINLVMKEIPDVVFIWIGCNIDPQTLLYIKTHSRAIIVNYIHDDPFSHLVSNLSPYFHRLHYRKFIKSLSIYDHVFFSKNKNVKEAFSFGCKSASVLMQYYCQDIHYPRMDENTKYPIKNGVVFAGHYEPDGRDLYINSLAEINIDIKVYCDATWKKSKLANNISNLKIFPRADGEEYSKVISSANIAMCFMSKMNRDDYTTRCFEIPALGTLLLCERTNEMLNIYREDEEAVFFSSINELKSKVISLLNNREILEKITRAGNARVKSSHHCVNDRADEFLKIISELLINRSKQVEVH